MPATAWDSSCSAWSSVFSHWLMANYSSIHPSCWLSGWQCLVASLCSASFIFLVGLSEASAFPWPAMSPALRYRGSQSCAPDEPSDIQKIFDRFSKRTGAEADSEVLSRFSDLFRG